MYTISASHEVLSRDDFDPDVWLRSRGHDVSARDLVVDAALSFELRGCRTGVGVGAADGLKQHRFYRVAAFQKGQSGNPRGRPVGARHKATLAAEALLDGEAEALTRKAIEAALDGDTVAMRLWERILPARRSRPVQFAIPPLKSVADAGAVMAAIVEAVSASEISPDEAAELSQLLEISSTCSR